MSEICKAKYRWTHEELSRSMRHHYRLKLRRVLLLMRVFSIVLLSFLGIVLLAWALLPSTSAPPFWALLLLAAFCFYWLFIDRLNAWNSSRGFRKRPDANTETEWQFSNDEIKTRSEFGEATFHWKSFIKVIDAGDGFLFYSLKNLFHWLPFSAFESPQCIETVRELVRRSGIPLLGPKGRGK